MKKLKFFLLATLLFSLASIVHAQSFTNPIVNTSGGGGTPGGSSQQIQYNDGGSFGGAVGFVWDKINSFLGLGTTTPYATFSITNTGTNPSFVIEDSASPDLTPFYIDANGGIGIGTTTSVSSSKLKIDSSLSQSLVITNSVTTNQPELLTVSASDGSTVAWRYNESAPNGVIPADVWERRIGGTARKEIYSYFSIYPTLTVDTSIASGGIGIGSTTPASKLSISKWTTDSANFPLMMVSTSTVSATTTVFMIDSNGKIGVGTTSPTAAQLNVAGKGYFTEGGTFGNGPVTQGAIVDYYGSKIQMSHSSMTHNVTGQIPSIAFGQLGSNSTNGALNIFGLDRSNFAPALKLTGIQAVTTAGGTQPAVAIVGIRGATGSTSGRPMDFAEKILEIQNLDSTRPLMTMLGNGNIGISTSTPSGLLSLTASSTFTGPLLIVATSTGGTSTTTAFFLDNNGNMFLPNQTLSTAGNAVCRLSTGQIVNAGNTTCVTSSLRFKTNIKSIISKDALDIVLKLTPRTFTRKTPTPSMPTGEEVGFIAEEVQKVAPKLVEYEEDGKTPRSVNYPESTAYLTGAIQELNNRLVKLEKENETLKLQVKSLTK